MIRSPALPIAALALVATLTVPIGETRAQTPLPGSSTELQVEIFEPMPAQGVNLLNLARSDVMQHLYPSAGVFFHYAHNPFELVRQDDEDIVVSRLVEGQARVELWAALGFLDYFDVGLVMPLVVAQSGAGLALFNRPSEAVDGFVVGDMRLVPKVRPFDPADAGGFGLALALPLYIPTGDAESFNSYGYFRFKPTLVLDWRDEDSGFVVAANVGYMLQPRVQAHNLVLDDGVHWGLGFEIPLGRPEMKILASAFGVVPLEDNLDPADLSKTLSDSRTMPIEADLAFQVRLGPVVLQVGGGMGLTSGIGAPDVRGFASVGYTPVTRDRDGDGILDRDDDCPDDPEDKDGFQDQDGCPDTDNDQDGVLDVSDGARDATGFGACRDIAEDKDLYQDEDGCPDPDNDADGIADADDGARDATGFGACRDQPEDKDGHQDADGCPEPDNDADGVADTEDGPRDAAGFGTCRDQPEDKDGHQDIDGCPDPDNDGDGIPDVADGARDATGFGECRDQPETKNEYNDEDGCPDEAPKKVRITRFQIEILDKVFFEYNKAVIQEVSFDLLTEVARVIREHPQVTKIRVEGHTDWHGDDAYNLKLSQERADAVRVYLEAKGVETQRLVSEGFGETKPLIPGAAGKSKAGMAKNRRVEFHIIEVNGMPHSPDKPVILEKHEEVTP
ncbi:MAG: OmpA family protein [Deltaproteobacteria bacterium]|nr:OmpA family protein [Deltaproteobacteria bacterium]